jgi:hypothetical protein
MRKVDSLSSSDGRKILHEIFRELKYKKQLGSLAILSSCWKICVYDTDLTKYIKTEDTVLHRLGFFKGTRIWMEEIVNRFYFSAINSFVYFGASVLLVVIGVRRFSDSVDDRLVIAGVVFEALMLFFMFIVMLFSPTDDEDESQNNEDSQFQKDELLTEIGEIAKDFANSSIQLETISNELMIMNDSQKMLIEKINVLGDNFQQMASPNPEMLIEMKQVNSVLSEFKQTIQELNQSALQLRKEEIEITVRRELEKILTQTILNR